MPRSGSDLGGLAHQAAWYCAVLTIALLLLQPLLCTITCLVHHHGQQAAASSGHEHSGHAEAAQAAPRPAPPFTCHFQTPSTPHPLFVPAFWPGLLSLFAIALAIGGLLHRLAPQPPARPLSRRWAPPIPPPRAIGA